MLNGMFSGNNKERNRPTPKPFSQNSRFDCNWGKASPVEKAPPRTVESSSSSRRTGNYPQVITGEHPIAIDAQSVSQKIKETLDAGSSNSDGHQQIITDLAPRDLLIIIYELLKTYAVEYNAAVGLGPFYLELTRPHEVSGPLRLQNDARPSSWLTKVRAGLATSTHSLLLCADDGVLAFYVMPLEQLRGSNALGKDAVENQEPRTFLQFNKMRGGVFYWETKAGLPLTMSRVDATCRALFQWLIERTADRVAGD